MALQNNHIVTLDGFGEVLWDYRLGNFAEIELTNDAVLTVINMPNTPAAGNLKVTANGFTLTLFGITTPGFAYSDEFDDVQFIYDHVANSFRWSIINYGATTGGGDVTAPSMYEARVDNANPDIMILNHDEVLDDTSVPAAGDFSVSGGKTVTGVDVTGTSVNLTLNTPYAHGDVITVSYTPGTNKIKDLAGNLAAALTNHAVTNNIAAGFDPLTDLPLIAYHDPELDITTVVSGSDLLVSALKDQMDPTNANKALVQGTSANRPKLIAGAINGHDVMHFDTANAKLASTSLTVSKPYTRMAMVEFKAFSGLGYALGSVGAGNESDLGVYDPGGGYKAFMYAGNVLYEETALGTIQLDTPVIVQMDFVGDGVNDKLYFNGVLQATGNAGSGSLLAICLGLGGGSTANCRIGIHFLSDLLDSTERANATNYFKTYYGIA